VVPGVRRALGLSKTCRLRRSCPAARALGTRLSPRRKTARAMRRARSKKGRRTRSRATPKARRAFSSESSAMRERRSKRGEEVRHRGPPHQGLGGAVEEVEEEGVGVGPLGHQGGQDLVDRPRQEEEDDGRKPSQEEGEGLAQEVAVQGLHRSLQVR
jgi:hypothetical protein